MGKSPSRKKKGASNISYTSPSGHAALLQPDEPPEAPMTPPRTQHTPCPGIEGPVSASNPIAVHALQPGAVTQLSHATHFTASPQSLNTIPQRADPSWSLATSDNFQLPVPLDAFGYLDATSSSYFPCVDDIGSAHFFPSAGTGLDALDFGTSHYALGGGHHAGSISFSVGDALLADALSDDTLFGDSLPSPIYTSEPPKDHASCLDSDLSSPPSYVSFDSNDTAPPSRQSDAVAKNIAAIHRLKGDRRPPTSPTTLKLPHLSTPHGSMSPAAPSTPSTARKTKPPAAPNKRRRAKTPDITNTPVASTHSSQGKRPKAVCKRSPAESPEKGFICPFFSHDNKTYRDCFKVVLTRISDVKQHLRRQHAQKAFCLRCKKEFDSEPELEAHCQEVDGCQPIETKQPDGISAKHRTSMGRYPRVRNDPAAQWFAIWDTVFPGLDRPAFPFKKDCIPVEISEILDFVKSGEGRLELGRAKIPTDFSEHLVTVVKLFKTTQSSL